MEEKRFGYQSGPSPVIKGPQIRIHPAKKVIKVKERKEPQVEVRGKRGIVQGLEILCTCGEKIKIDFEYDTSSSVG